MEFKAKVELNGKTATGIEVPAEAVEQLGAGKKPAVYATIGSYTYRSTVASMGGRYMLPLSAEHRAGAGVAAGDEVEVSLRLDTEPREVQVPGDLAAALAGAPEARAFFEGLSNSNKSRITLSVEGAKTEETRRRRIEKAVQALSEGKVV
ncbi:YdeI/OmpD-associated family protein [Cohnella ginsengisoli]|uniref:YdeI/OmpD-associated family protein n=1 Tax=Cohnella ginsengisoli TaxID=425004 RepID=A0A9X4QQP6_9BACL|nr:YdeI/OmpD-associated family protein [Cohnella ginsengisoli]MDG0794826.1 YdeI/OmpD-associated family protein [Cohnella ginsengisoli]